MEIQRMSSRTTSTGLHRNEDANLEAANGVTAKKGMILPFTPLAMSFEDVSYFVDMPPVRFYTSTHFLLVSIIIYYCCSSSISLSGSILLLN